MMLVQRTVAVEKDESILHKQQVVSILDSGQLKKWYTRLKHV